jgi:hypothetical protein
MGDICYPGLKKYEIKMICDDIIINDDEKINDE